MIYREYNLNFSVFFLHTAREGGCKIVIFMCDCNMVLDQNCSSLQSLPYADLRVTFLRSPIAISGQI